MKCIMNFNQAQSRRRKSEVVKTHNISLGGSNLSLNVGSCTNSTHFL